MDQLTIGILAHVDAGKTTLSEALLFESGSIRRLGRVDHGDAFLDTYSLERERGITIFSKQAIIDLSGLRLNLIDTPGHIDFSAEMERTLSVLDLAILVVSATDGVQSHTRTLFRLFERYRVPVFVFVNKMDLFPGDRKELISALTEAFGAGFVDLSEGVTSESREEIAVLDEGLLERFLENEEAVSEETVRELIAERKLFPCYFGSALRGISVKELLLGLSEFAPRPACSCDFSARVFKITRDEKNNRLTFLKLTGGRLAVRPEIAEYGEKVDQIRLYNGEKYETVREIEAGTVAAVTGLTGSRIGDRLGESQEKTEPDLIPVLNYSVIYPEGMDASVMYVRLKTLEEEDPSLSVRFDEETRELRMSLMGQVQQEIVKNLVKERFGCEIDFTKGSIIYKETIENTVEGVGHFEPLRHYAEVHLILSPLERGSGLVIENRCLPDTLSVNFQNLILTHLTERRFPGVLTGSEITDLKITLRSGKSHIKHTEGGDFRQATYRAVRQGLLQAESVLLEPWYDFVLTVPEQAAGRAMTDLDRMGAKFKLSGQTPGGSEIKGSCPAREISNYAEEVRRYTRGEGELTLSYAGYFACGNPERVIEEIGYDPERDLLNSGDSVFCRHGAGEIVPWYEVFDNMHLPSVFTEGEEAQWHTGASGRAEILRKKTTDGKALSTEEIDKIIDQTYYSNKRARKHPVKKRETEYEYKKSLRAAKVRPKKPEFVLVDGYNVIFSWEELKELAGINIDSARDRLVDILGNYQGLADCELLVVFDAYNREGHQTETQRYGRLGVVYTAEAQTADGYIEQFTREQAAAYDVTVVTSDGTEQVIAAGAGCRIVSSRDFKQEVIALSRQAAEEYIPKNPGGVNYLGDQVRKLNEDEEKEQ
ncbi:MAG: TetM/TetW/TetO/TetS family tetracycline resistance ribosomal protection protein [Lachnospiraceae bacterium]|nr:TetM/TetW/TetO/TetS family tetracycline resistance ribosomal protection protein [Lachnospiraceae bacterium]